ncbi:MAG: hypothetical protein OES69_04365 [Myxococcales bacterium]|nr:hypothetical protein [Myxococcales bacterium]
MAYVSSGLSLLTPSLSGAGPQLWMLQTSDALATVNTDGYISDGDARGMRAGDIVISVQLASFTDQYTKGAPVAGAAGSGIYVVLSVAAGGAADLGDGTAIVTTDTD